MGTTVYISKENEIEFRKHFILNLRIIGVQALESENKLIN